jgi:hypothetical protein
MIDHATPAEKQIHMIVDNYSTLRCNCGHPRFHAHFTPTGCSWLNIVARFFRDLTQTRLRRGIFHDDRTRSRKPVSTGGPVRSESLFSGDRRILARHLGRRRPASSANFAHVPTRYRCSCQEEVTIQLRLIFVREWPEPPVVADARELFIPATTL